MAPCLVCGGALPAQRGPRARRYCSRACQAKAYRARQRLEHRNRIVPEGERELLETYAEVPATELADSLSAAARRLADALDAGQPADDSDLGAVARIPVVLAARARQAVHAPHGILDHPSKTLAAAVDQTTDTAPRRSDARAPARQASRDDSALPSPKPAAPLKETSPARRGRLSQKAARAVVDGARLVKAADHRDTYQWNLVAEDGTVLGHVEPSYGGSTGRTGRNGWKYRLAGSLTAGGGPARTREEAAAQCALAWIRVVTAPVRRSLTAD
ncbi:hypothetical protein [Streptomyces sp. WG5]|uniref:hypothetical protein n=1 Tax=Streptomyces sp. WG5 TaxID=3417648 RepID=UPI003CE97F2E